MVLHIIRLLLLVFVFSLFPSLSARSEADQEKKPVSVEADAITYDQATETYEATGAVYITFAELTLRADRVILDLPRNQAFAFGKVKITMAADTLEGEKVVFDLVRGTGTVYEGKAFLAKNHFYLRGRRIEKTGDQTYRGVDVTATTCDGEVPDWKLAGREIDVTIDGYGTLKHGRFMIRGIPVFYVPYLIFPAKTTRQSGFLLPRLSYSRNIHGLDVEVPYYQVISESMDGTIYLRYLEASGVKAGGEFRYALGEHTRGTFYGDYLDDRRIVAETLPGISRDWPEGRARWSLYWNHETQFSPGANLRIDVMGLSDIWYFRDFQSSNYYLDNYSPRGEGIFRRISFLGNESLTQVGSTARLVKKWDYYNLTALLRHTEDLTKDKNEATLQKYPEIAFNMARRSLFASPVNYEFQSLYSYNYREVGQKGHLADIHPLVSVPYKMGDYLQVTPFAGLKATLWNRDDGKASEREGSGVRYVANTGINLLTELHRVFDFGSQGLEKLKHTIRPELAYSYTASAGGDNIADYAPAAPEVNSLTYGLTNTLLARMRDEKGRVSYLNILRLKLSQAYDLREATRRVVPPAETKPWGNILLEIDLAPSTYLNFSARSAYDVYLGQLRQNNYDVGLKDNRGNSLTAGYRYTKENLEELHLLGKAALTRQAELTYLWKRDLLQSRDRERTIGLNYRKQCWLFEFSYTEKERDTLYQLSVSLYGLGKIGN